MFYGFFLRKYDFSAFWKCCGSTFYHPDALPVIQPAASKHAQMLPQHFPETVLLETGIT